MRRGALWGRAVRARAALLWAAALLPAGALEAQEPLSLAQAARIALDSHPAVEAANAGVGQAESHVRIARAGYLPRISVSESYTRSNSPVFAFSSLLNQRSFTEADFAVERLNHPGSVQNFQSALRVEQTLFDANRTKHAIEAARLRSEMSSEQARSAEANVLLGVARTYWGARAAEEAVTAAEAAVEAADADLKRASNRFDAGLATRADVLAIETQLAAAREQNIRALSDGDATRAALNDALGLELDRRFELSDGMEDAEAVPQLAAFLELAAEQRPEIRQALFRERAAEADRRGAESALYPRAVGFGSVQADTRRFVAGGSGGWFAGVALEWDVWKGAENRARVAAARFGEQQAAAERRQAGSRAFLEVRQAHAALVAAAERVRTTEAVVERAEEAHRIIRDRYDAGLADITELLRGQSALTEARFRRLAALYDRRVSRAELSHAAGALTADSEALR